MKQVGHLKLNGQKFQARYSRAEERLKQYVETMPDDEILGIGNLARVGFSNTTVVNARESLLQAGMCYMHEARVYYGNKKAIASLKALLVAPKP